MKYIFGRGLWNKNDLIYAYSPVATSFTEFGETDDCIMNAYNESIKGYDYVSLAAKKRYGDGTKVMTKCSFDSFGAPLITIANGFFTDENGRTRYDAHYEIVAYEGGCNVWYIVPCDEDKEKPYKVSSVVKVRYEIEPKSIVELETEIKGGFLNVSCNGVRFSVPAPKLEETFYVGVTACEGINRFYELQIDEEEKA